MTLQTMDHHMADGREINYQMALDLIEGEEATARRLGVPTVTETMNAPAGRRVGARDPDWFTKLERLTTH